MAKYSEFKYSQAPYGARVRVYKQISILWSLFGNIVKEFTLVWNLFDKVYQTYSLKWNLFGYAYKTLTLKWSIFAQIYQTFTLKWNVYAHIHQTYSLKWTLFAEACKTLILKWDLSSIGGLYFSPIFKPTTSYNSVTGVTSTYDSIAKNTDSIWTNINTTGHKYGTFKYGTRRYGRISINSILKPTTTYNNVTEVKK